MIWQKYLINKDWTKENVRLWVFFCRTKVNLKIHSITKSDVMRNEALGKEMKWNVLDLENVHTIFK